MNNYSFFQDHELVKKLEVDDERALNELYLRYWDKLLSVAMHRLNNLEIAEEIVQDIFVKLWQRRHEVQITGTVATYLAVAVKYRVINELDKAWYKRNHTEPAEEHFVLHAPAVDELIFERELLKRVEEIIKALPEKCRLIFKMSRESDLTYKQIASELDISEKTVEAHMHKALKQLRAHIGLCMAIVISYLRL